MDHKCQQCGKTFSSNKNLKEHVKRIHQGGLFKCPQCDAKFNVKANLTRHLKTHNEAKEVFTCTICAKTFATKDNLKRHMRTHPAVESCKHESALEGSAVKKSIKVLKPHQHDLIVAMHAKEKDIVSHISDALDKWNGVKWHIIVKVKFVRNNADGESEFTNAFFNGACHTCLAEDEIQDGMEQSVMKIGNSFTEFQRHGSSWVLDKVEEIYLKLVQYKPLNGSSYIPTPSKLAHKLAIVNPQNKDKKCFMWAVLAGLYPAEKDAHRITKYTEHVDKLNFTDIDFPVKISDIDRFEKHNNISVNVFGYESGEVFPVRITKLRCDNHVNLLLLSNGRQQHYCWIKNLDRLLHHTKRHAGNTYFCQYCLHGFTKESLLQNHIKYCSVHSPTKIEMPNEEEKWLKFKDFAKQIRVPYVVYADFESLLVEMPSDTESTSQTKKIRHHVASGFTYKVVSAVPGQTFPHVTYRGQNVADVFIEQMLKVEEDLKMRLKINIQMNLTPEDEENFKMAKDCHICKNPLDSDRVRDHDHHTGEIILMLNFFFLL